MATNFGSFFRHLAYLTYIHCIGIPKTIGS